MDVKKGNGTEPEQGKSRCVKRLPAEGVMLQGRRFQKTFCKSRPAMLKFFYKCVKCVVCAMPIGRAITDRGSEADDGPDHVSLLRRDEPVPG